MTAILGISAFYHDSAAALVFDGEIVAAAQEERFTRKKHDAAFPMHAIAYCLQEAKLEARDVDYVAFYDKPLAKFERLLETYLAYAPRGFRSFCCAMPVWLKDKLHIRRSIRRGLGGAPAARQIFLDHHESHAASAFFPSPFDEAAILTIDGVGEWSTTTYGTVAGNRICLTQHLQFPRSVGLLYSAFTYYCGFKVNSGEYKLMGLAPYGKPIYQELITRHLIDLRPDGSFHLNMDYFNYCQGLTMTGRRFHRLFGAPPRRAESALQSLHLDLAASIQAVTEEIILRMGRHLYQKTRQQNLVLAGGVALNCVANGRLLREGPFQDIWIQPAAGDAGGALGAALFVWHQLLDRPRIPRAGDAQHGSLLGPAYCTEEIEPSLKRAEVAYQRFDDEAELLDYTAHLLAQEKVVGWFQGRMEFGPRALGARSILGDPRSPRMQSVMNRKIKFRESFRPFAPAVLKEYAHQWFGLEPGQESPYMLLVAPVRQQHRLSVREVARPDACTSLKRKRRGETSRALQACVPAHASRSTIPAVTHVDYSARMQTVDAQRNPRFHRLLEAFHERTGCPMLVNTSFNVRGEPIVCTPQDAFRCFLATEMDALILGDFVLEKEKIVQENKTRVRHEHLAQFQLD